MHTTLKIPHFISQHLMGTMAALLHVLVSFAAVTYITSERLQCHAPWVKVHRACYKFVKNHTTFDVAMANCLEDGANLASIGSMAEKMKLMRRLSAIIRKPNQGHWWVGLQHDRNSAVWRWSDGAELNGRVTPWGPGEPNNGKDNEFCAEFRVVRGNLNDVSCDTRRYYICELNKITPAPTTSTTSVPITTATKQTAMSASTTTIPATTTTRKPSRKPESSKKHPITPETPKTQDSTDIQKPTSKVKPTLNTKSTSTTMSDTSVVDDVDSISKNKFTTKTYPANNHKRRNKMPAPRQRTHCPKLLAYGLVWPKSKRGEVRSVTCNNGVGGIMPGATCGAGDAHSSGTSDLAFGFCEGKATWQCGKNPVRWSREPDTRACASQDFKDLMLRVSPEKTDRSPIVTTEAIRITTDLVRKTAVSKPMSLADISVSTAILRKVTNVKPKSTEQAVKLVKELIKAGSNLMMRTGRSTDVRRTDRRRAASSILSAMEDSTKYMAELIKEPTVLRTSTDKIGDIMTGVTCGAGDAHSSGTPDLTFGFGEELELHVVNTTDTTEALVCGDDKGYNDMVSIPAATLKQLSTDGLSKVVFMKHSDIGEFLGADNESKSVPRIASNIISVSIGNVDTTTLPQPVTFSLRLLEILSDDVFPLCSFWNFSEGDSGKWSQAGCLVSDVTSDRVTCQCSHLTSFAILLDISGVEISHHHQTVLRYITYVGCIVSLMSLFTSWLTFNCLSPLQSDRNSIHKNLVFCLFAAELIFVIGIEQTDKKVDCAIIALLLHFFFLAAFTWMLMEAIQIVVMLVQVFDTAKSSLRYFYMAGYGVPIVIVATTAGIDFTAYGTPKYCWLTTDRYFILSFAGPVAGILLVNAGILTYAMSTVCRHSDYVFSREKANAGNFKAWIQGALALEVLLGLTWIFGYFFINEETLTLAYIFTVLNSLQGLFIFIFHCMLNKKVRHEYKKLVHISKKPPAVSTTKSASLRKTDGSYVL